MSSLRAADDRTFASLDAARGVAALAVALHHQTAINGQLIPGGFLAVDFFFALSGFVLAHAYGNKLASGRMSAGEFMIARIVRLYPLYLLGLMAMLFAMSPALPWSLSALAGKLPFALAMLPSPTLDAHGFIYPFNIPSWSIFFELLINVVMAVFCVQLRNVRIRWAVIAMSGVALGLHVLKNGGTLDDGGGNWDGFGVSVGRVTFSFLIGAQLYDWHQRGVLKIAARWQSTLVLSCLVVLVACLAARPRGWLEIACIVVVFPLLIHVLGHCRLELGVVGRALRNLGIASYALYMLHGAFQYAFVETAHWLGIEPTQWPIIGIPVLALTVLGSWAADRWLDRPGRKFLQRALRRWAEARGDRHAGLSNREPSLIAARQADQRSFRRR